MTSLLAANPGPAVHLALLGGILVAVLVVLAVRRVRRRELRGTPGEQPGAEREVREHDSDHPDRRSAEEETAEARGDDEHPSHRESIG